MLLHSFLNSCVSLTSDARDFMEELIDEDAVECCDNSSGERCYLLESALGSAAAGASEPTLASVLEALGRNYLQCQQCRHVLREALRRLAAMIDKEILYRGLCTNTNPLKEDLLRTAKGRRRQLCEDYKFALTAEMASRKRKSGNQIVRVVDGVDTKRLRYEYAKQMKAYQTAGWRFFFERSGVFACAEDATRIGEPARETVAYLATHVATNVCVALPVQALPFRRPLGPLRARLFGVGRPTAIFFGVCRPTVFILGVGQPPG